MATLNYADLMADAAEEAAASTLTFVAKDGKTVLIRPIDSLGKADLNLVMKYIDIVGDDKVATETKLDTIDLIIITASDLKKSMTASLEDMPIKVKMKIFETWMASAEVGNS